jgi:hypothetical protein
MIDPAVVAKMTDAEMRGAAAARGAAEADALGDEFRVIRDKAVVAMLKGGKRPAEVARVIGVTRAYMARWRGVNADG